VFSEVEAARGAKIKKGFGKQKLLGGAGKNGPIAQLQKITEGLCRFRIMTRVSQRNLQQAPIDIKPEASQGKE